LEDVVDDPPQLYDPERPNMSAEAFADMQERYLRVCAGRDMQGRFEATAADLLRFRDEVVAAGCPFVVVICPAELQVEPARLREALAVTELDPRPTEAQLFAPQEFLRSVFEREHVDHVDLLPAFRAAAPDGPLYGLRDSHWNVAGNRLAASVLGERLPGLLSDRAARGDER
jgi:hypothetical protein